MMTDEQDQAREEADRWVEEQAKKAGAYTARAAKAEAKIFVPSPTVAQKQANPLRTTAKAMKDRGTKILLEKGQFPVGDTGFKVDGSLEILGVSVPIDKNGGIREYVSIPVIIAEKSYRIKLPYNNAVISLLGDIEGGYVDFIASKESGQFGRTTFKKQKKVL